ncbi:VTC domain-containing protein [Phycomyces nitens]|nr:VTC domain-containing protein [Phycomyces nitens]
MYMYVIMKFAEQLANEAFPPWRTHYIKYGLLKTELKNRQADHEWNEEDESYFTHMLEQELENVYNTMKIKLEDINSRIKYCDATIQTLKNSQSWSSDESWESTETILTETLFDLNDLAKFIRLNYNGFRKIIKKHDRWAPIKLENGFVPQLRAKPLDTQQLDVPIVYISNLKDICNRRGKPRTGNTAAGGDQLDFERATSKYWIHPDNINEVKSIIMLHLPVLIFDSEKTFEPEDSAISSIYFDSPEFDLYTGRLQRDDGAEAIRLRWYGPTSSKSVFIERKTHHASWLNGKSIKDRFRLDVDDVQKFVTGELTADTIVERLRAKGETDDEALGKIHFIAQGIQESILEKKLSPVCRVFYNRTAFQIPGDQRVRVSLDTNLTFIREDNMDGVQRRGENEWRRSDIGINHPFNNIPRSEVVEFLHGVLEIKLQTHLDQKPPEWLEKLLESHLVHEVTRFSKYLHGASYLYPEKIPLVPWWIAELEQDIRKPRATNFGLSRSPSYRPLINGEYGIAWEAEKHRMEATSNVMEKHISQRITNALGEQVTMVNPNNDGKNDDNTLQVPATNTGDYQLKDAQNADTGLVSPPASLDSGYQEGNGFPQQYEILEREPIEIVETGEAPFVYGDQKDIGYNVNQTLPKNTTFPGTVGLQMGEKINEKVVIQGNNCRLDIPEGAASSRKRSRFSAFLLKRWGGEAANAMNPDGTIKGKIKKIKVEPKVFFANERTFISWLQFAALLLAVALSLLNFGDPRTSYAGAVFIGIAVLVCFYALYRFEKRAWMLKNNIKGRYDDMLGPAVLCAFLVGALVVNLYLRFT